MNSEYLKQFQKLSNELYQRLDIDPSAAVSEVRSLTPNDELDKSDLDVLKSSIFIDGGSQLRDSEIVEEGIKLLEDLTKDNPEQLDLVYNLGNGFSALSQFRSSSVKSYLETSELRQKARTCFEKVGSTSTRPELRGRAMTNQANLLSQSYRWLEAYELYREAVQNDPANSVASSGAAKILLWAAKFGVGPNRVLRSLAARYLRQTQKYGEELTKYAGPEAIKVLDELPNDVQTDIDWPPDLTGSDEYTRFVGKNHLALSLTIEGLNPDLKRWDSLMIHSIREDLEAPHGVPVIFSMFNVLKSDYLTARWLVYQALHNKIPESGVYSDTLDYSKYGVRESLLALGQRSVIDILDRIAVATSEYLNLQDNPNSIYFWKRWHVHTGRKLKTPLEWQPEIREEIEKGNKPLIALAEIAEDIATGGYLAPQRTLRNASTHRFVVLHDLSTKPSRESRYMEHYNDHDFKRQTISALRLVRAALIYFVNMVSAREARLEREGEFVVPQYIPSHHWIRGENNEKDNQ